MRGLRELVVECGIAAGGSLLFLEAPVLLGGRTMSLSIRNQRRVVRWGYVLGSEAVLVLLAVFLESGFCLFLASLNCILSFRLLRIALVLEKLLIPIASCRSCGTQVDLIDHWDCPCGYISEISKHIFDKCPNCGRDFNFLFCDKCQVSLDL